MKNTILVLAMVVVLFVSTNAFAEYDGPLQNITNWTPVSTQKGVTVSYEHAQDHPLYPLVYKYDDTIGYMYFHIKGVPAQEQLEAIQKDLKEKYPKEFENARLGYLISESRIDCKSEMVENIQDYIYSDTNKLIISYATTPNARPLKGSAYEQIPFNKKWIKQEKEEVELKEKEEAALKEKEEVLKRELNKYSAEALVHINQLEVNPYEFEGRTIAVIVQFKKMLSKDTASFYSGNTDLEQYTNVYDEIIVSGIPKGSHFESGLFSPRMMLVLKGKGTKIGTNAFGAKIKAPHFRWIAIIAGKQTSVLEEQRDVSKKNALQNLKNSRPSRRY